MYSQNNEEQHIVDFFKSTKGRFLDIGAFDGKTFSNTLRLAEMGWSGVMIEPEAHVFVKLMKNLELYPNVKLVNAAFAQKNGVAKFYSSQGDAISSTSETHKKKWETGWSVKYQEIYVPLITIDDVFQQFGEHFDFVNLDVESTNLELLRVLPFDKMTTKMICVEHDTHISEMKEYCKKYGLSKEILRNGENLILVK